MGWDEKATHGEGAGYSSVFKENEALRWRLQIEIEIAEMSCNRLRICDQDEDIRHNGADSAVQLEERWCM